jgi:hypothetical protein
MWWKLDSIAMDLVLFDLFCGSTRRDVYAFGLFTLYNWIVARRAIPLLSAIIVSYVLFAS